MDRRLILATVATLLASSAFFIYHKFLATPVTMNVTIFPKDKIFIGENITFQDHTDGADYWIWSFGDGEYSTEQQGKHTYLEAANYDVQLTASGTFGTLQSRKFRVEVLPGKPKTATPEIGGESVVQPGKPASYTAPFEAASMEWRLEGEALYRGKVQKGKTCTWVLKTPGQKKLILQTTGPDNEITKDISVVEKAQAEVVSASSQSRPHPVKPIHKPVKVKPNQDDDEFPFNHGKGVPVKE